MKSIVSAFALLVCALAGTPAHADGPVLIELFASKNCQACPKAHKTLKAVEASRSDVFILTWSVNYWDYLGGKDKMAIPASNDRQRGYADHFRQRGPYTPQTVYAGTHQCPGNKPAQVDAAIEKAVAQTATGVTLTRSSSGVTLDGKTSELTDIWFVTYLEGADNQTKMVNPVTSARLLSPWLGGRTTFKLPECTSGCAVIIQEAGYGRVLAALDVTP